ncbi:hypothetical protein CEXT_774511 [Caerostris extrusa]|uniref:Uncharacterized protein n=1 Tax=Caerostris extrusa TaxID=172846 RepID=A0AAV4YG45_CAEEX|nr:hypothetical protein CEXT_774511 [Caerostris extrusa]
MTRCWKDDARPGTSQFAQTVHDLEKTRTLRARYRSLNLENLGNGNLSYPVESESRGNGNLSIKVFMQVKGYEDFRFFFLAMNLALLPGAPGLGPHLRTAALLPGGSSTDGTQVPSTFPDIPDQHPWSVLVSRSPAGHYFWSLNFLLHLDGTQVPGTLPDIPDQHPGSALYLGALWAMYRFRVPEEGLHGRTLEKYSHQFSVTSKFYNVTLRDVESTISAVNLPE